MSGPVKDLLEADDEDTLVATQQLIKMYDTISTEHRGVATTYIKELEKNCGTSNGTQSG